MSTPIDVYSEGLVNISVCALKTATKKEIEEQVNLDRPTGVKSSWKINMRKKFKDGSPNGVACNHYPDKYRHYLLNC